MCTGRVSRRGDSAWHGHEKFRRSRSTFARRWKKHLFLPISRSLSLSLSSRPPTVNWVDDRVASSAISCREHASPINDECLWPRKSFSSADFSGKRRRETESRRIRAVSSFIASLGESDLSRYSMGKFAELESNNRITGRALSRRFSYFVRTGG